MQVQHSDGFVETITFPLPLLHLPTKPPLRLSFISARFFQHFRKSAPSSTVWNLLHDEHIPPLLFFHSSPLLSYAMLKATPRCIIHGSAFQNLTREFPKQNLYFYDTHQAHLRLRKGLAETKQPTTKFWCVFAQLIKTPNFLVEAGKFVG